MFDRVFDFYEFLWKDLNWIGRFTFFPLLLLLSPLVFFVLACLRD